MRKNEMITFCVCALVLVVVVMACHVKDYYQAKPKSRQAVEIQMLREQLEKCRQFEKLLEAENGPERGVYEK